MIRYNRVGTDIVINIYKVISLENSRNQLRKMKLEDNCESYVYLPALKLGDHVWYDVGIDDFKIFSKKEFAQYPYLNKIHLFWLFNLKQQFKNRFQPHVA